MTVWEKWSTAISCKGCSEPFLHAVLVAMWPWVGRLISL